MSTSMSPSAVARPRLSSLPLTVGAHLDPVDGACVMELVSASAGEPWSDEPACTQPLVAHVARLVNDRMSDGARQRLRDFVPALAGAGNDDAGAHARVAHACTAYALRVGASPLLVHFHRAAARQLVTHDPASVTVLSRRRWAVPPMPGWAFRHGPAFRAVEASVSVCARGDRHERDRHLVSLLGVAVAAVGAGGASVVR